MSDFLNSNEWQWRLACTVMQGVLGVVGGSYDQPTTPRRAVGNPG